MDIQMMIVVAFRYLVFCHKLWQITTFDMSLFLLSWQIFRYNTRPAFIPESTVVGYWLGFVQWMMSNDDVGGEFRMVAVDLVACILLLSAAAGWLLYLILVVVVIVIFIVSVLLSDSCLLLGVHRPRVVDGWEGWYYHSPLTDDSSIVGMVYSPTAYCCVYCCYKDNITWTAQQMVWSEWRQEWTWLIVVCGINWIVRRMFVHDVQQRTINDAQATIVGLSFISLL